MLYDQYLQQSFMVVTIIFSILQVRKMRLRKVK